MEQATSKSSEHLVPARVQVVCSLFLDAGESFSCIGWEGRLLSAEIPLQCGRLSLWDHKNSPAWDGGFPYPARLMCERLELGENFPGASWLLSPKHSFFYLDQVLTLTSLLSLNVCYCSCALCPTLLCVSEPPSILDGSDHLRQDGRLTTKQLFTASSLGAQHWCRSRSRRQEIVIHCPSP